MATPQCADVLLTIPDTLHCCVPAAILQHSSACWDVSSQDSCQDRASGHCCKHSGLPGVNASPRLQ
jgi:hypothetical protein